MTTNNLDKTPQVTPAGEAKPPSPQPTIPPPPQPTEYYPGFTQELEGIVPSIYSLNKQATEAYENVKKIESKGVAGGWKGTIQGLVAGVLPPVALLNILNLGFSTQEAYDTAMAEAQAELAIQTQALESAEWKLNVLNALPGYFASRDFTINTLDDVLEVIPNSTLSDTDREWLQITYNKLEYLNNILPDDFAGSVEESQNYIMNEVLSEPSLETKAVHNLTIDELQRTFQTYAVDMPEGLSNEDLRSLLAEMELEDEVHQGEIKDYLRDLANRWALETDRLNLLRAGLLHPEAPELTPGEFVKMALTQPFMAGIQLLDKYFDMLPRPIASWAIIGAHNLFSTPDETLAGRMHDTYQAYREMGESSWNSYALAMTDTDMPWYVRMGIETVFDPTTYLGMGLATAAAGKVGGALSKIGLKTVGSRIGPFVGSIENGFIRGSDAVFKTGIHAVLSPIKGSFWLAGAGYKIPKTLTQMSRNFARQTSMDFKAIVERFHPEVKSIAGMTAKDIREAAELCIGAALERPSEGWDDMVKLGTKLLEFNYLDNEAANKLVKGVVKETVDFDTVGLTRLNDDILNMFSGQNPRITAGNIMNRLGIEQTDDAFKKMLTNLNSVREDIVDSAKHMFRSDKPNDQLIGMFNSLNEKRLANLKNPISTHLNQAGQSVSWVSRVADKTLQATYLINLERKVIMPFARWNLLFANFGPMNFLENMQRSFLGGAEIMYPKSYGGLDETIRLFRGLKNAPYELEMAHRGVQRLEMALIDPKTGSTAAFHNGSVPFVITDFSTWQFPLIQKPVGWKGRPIGKKINLRGVDYKITDLQSYNDVWEQLTTIQRSYDYHVHYMKSLPEVAPTEMGLITDAVLKRRSQLDEITKFSKKDMRDMERALIQDATVSPEAVLAHMNVDALELEKRQISKELGKLFDKCTDVRSITKKGIRDEVLDGRIFKDIDGRITAFADAERELSMASLAKQIDAMQGEATNFAKMYQGKTTLLDDLSQNIKLDRPVTEGVAFSRASIVVDGNNVGNILYHPWGDDPGRLIISEINVTKAGTLNRRFMQDVDLLVHDLAKQRGAHEVTVLPKESHRLMYEGAGYTKESNGWFTKKLMEPSSRAPKNLDELLGDMDNISAMQNAVDERIHDYRRLTELRSHNLKPGKEVDDFHVGSNKLLNKFMDESKDSMDSIVDNLQKFLDDQPVIFGPKGEPIGGVKLTDSQKGAVDSLTELYRMENSNVLTTRNNLARIEAKITATPSKSRNARFWQQQRAEKAALWDEHTINSRRLRNLRLDASRQFLTATGKTPYLPPKFVPMTGKLNPSHISYLFGVTGDDVYRGLTRVHNHVTVRPREDFIDYIGNQARAYANKFEKTVTDIGFTDDAIGEVYDQLWRNLGIEPSTLAPDSPTMMQLEEIRGELTRLHSSVKMDETDVARWRQYVQDIGNDVKEMPMYKEGAGEWFTKKESAMTKARELHELAYPTYDDANIIDETMRAIFPFWTYELFRWKWIPRTAMRTPGVFAGVTRYMDYTDGGYMPIPGTDLQINPLRGSIWMGGLRRFFLKDFPEYYDAVPGMEQMDYISRAGFFPGIHIMAPIVAFGTTDGGKPQLNELMPAFVKTGISALRELSPEHLGKVIDMVFPDRFRDFQTMLTLGAEGYDADEIWRKRQQGAKLTPEEETTWLRAEQKANGIKGILMEQTGLLRIKPPEYEEYRRESRLAIEEAIGVPVRIQQQIDRLYPVTGKRLSDYYKLDVLQQKLMYSLESSRTWQGIITPLYPSGWQTMEVKIRDYFDTLTNYSHQARYEGVYEDGQLVRPSVTEINRQLVDKEIGPDQWLAALSDIKSNQSEVARALGESPAYIDVPKTLEEREAWLLEKGIPTPTYGPDQELLWYYYELTPEYKFNWDSSRMELDFDTYYAKIDILLESLDEAHRQRLLDTIQLDWTPLERLYWTVSREYLRPYRNIRSIVLDQYSDEEKQQIRRFEVARGEERTELQNIMGEGGEKLISGFNTKVREARQRLRYLDPDLDAWSYFFGNTDSFLTTVANEKYNEFVSQYLTKEMLQ